jgi:predicted RNase H-like HicB family nuclease
MFSSIPSSCLVQIRAEPEGQFTAELPGFAERHATAATREEALEHLRALIRQQLDSGSLVCMDVPQLNPLMCRFGSAREDPDFDDYLEEIRKYREEVDRRAENGPDTSECSNTSSTPTT